jgi:cell division protease FtsH
LIDKEVRSFIDRNYARAKTILDENMDKLHAMAGALIKYETIDSAQIDDIMSGKSPRPPKDWDADTPPSRPGGGAEAPVTPSPDDKPAAGPIGGPAGEH